MPSELHMINELTSTQIWARMLDEKLNLTTLSLYPHSYVQDPTKKISNKKDFSFFIMKNSYYYFLIDSLVITSSSSSSTTICHQRAFSLPQNSNISVVNHNSPTPCNSLMTAKSLTSSTAAVTTAPTSSTISSPTTDGKSHKIHPVHHRTRSLPETDPFQSQSPPNFHRLLSSSYASHSHHHHETTSSTKINNNSMESIIEDYQNVDLSNNNGNRLAMANNGGNNSSILKQLSKMANSSSVAHKISHKRQHQNVMTASLRSTYSCPSSTHF